MIRTMLGGFLLAALPAAATATDLNLSIETPRSDLIAGVNHYVVTPGALIRYDVYGELSDDQNEGLAMFAFDLTFQGGPLLQASFPLGGEMGHFSFPDGAGNPAGFGGTLIAGDLLQVGGMQNTFNNSFAPQPVGTVLTGVALPGARQRLVRAGVRVPNTPGQYLLTLSNPMANVIREGETGVPFWSVEAARPGHLRPLLIEVQALTAQASDVSTESGGAQSLTLDAGPAHAGKPYWLLGSYSGTSPGIDLGGAHVPLNRDGYFAMTRNRPSSRILTGARGTLDDRGRASARFELPAGALDESWAGRQIHHAFVVFDGTNVAFVSNPTPVRLVP